MTPDYRRLLLSVMLFTNARGYAQEVTHEPTTESCPAAAEWIRRHTPPNGLQSKGGSDAPVSRVELLEQLKARVDRDQDLRRKLLADSNNENLADAVDAMDASNLYWLRRLIAEQGFPTSAQVGNEGVHLAWVLLQHADQDPKLQRKLLPILEQRYAAGELAANDLARFTDRTLVATGKPQRFGTQFDWFAGEFKLPESHRLLQIDAARKRIGLMPLADYVCTIRLEREKAR